MVCLVIVALGRHETNSVERRTNITSQGLFQPGDIPNPTMENWQKNMEPWETPAKGTQRQSQVQ